MRFRSVVATLALVLASAEVCAQDLYKLEASDRIELWTSVDENLRRTVTIGPDGWLSLPLVGHLRAAGLTAPELERAIQIRLRKYYKEEPDLTVMLLSGTERSQSIYVTGAVATPGSYPFRSGLLVVHSLSMAGGLLRGSAPLSEEERRITVTGEIDRLNIRMSALSAQVTRISSELEGAAYIPTASLSLADVGREQTILQARLNEEAGRKNAHSETIALRRQVIASLQEQRKTLEHRIALAEDRRLAISKLVSKGFANEAQLLELEGDIAELTGQRHELETEMASAELDVAEELARFRAGLAEREARLALELRDAERERDAVRSSLADNRKILDVLASGTATALAEEQQPLTISIVRIVGGRPVEIEASELSAIEPGDLVRVGRSATKVGPQPAGCPAEPGRQSDCVVLPAPSAATQPETSDDQRSPT